MRLLNPVAWLGALLVALPIAIHLFSRQPARTVAFPSLRFLDITRVLPTRRTSLTDLLLLLLRVLIVLSAVFALSQPLFATGGGASIARAVIVESADSSAAGLAVDSLLPPAAQRLVTHAPQARDNFSGALAWLRAQLGSRELGVGRADVRRVALFTRRAADSVGCARDRRLARTPSRGAVVSRDVGRTRGRRECDRDCIGGARCCRRLGGGWWLSARDCGRDAGRGQSRVVARSSAAGRATVDGRRARASAL